MKIYLLRDMMSNCCNIESTQQQRKTLIIVLIINAVVFGGQFLAALFAHSSALLADSFDMLGDVMAYALSLYAIKIGEHWIAKAALFKGILIALFGIAVLSHALYELSTAVLLPHTTIMIIFSLIGLIANGSCFWLLARHRHGDINMRSVWICARNDIIGNISVLVAAGLIIALHSRWPDIIVGLGMALVFFYSAFKIIKEAYKQLAE